MQQYNDYHNHQQPHDDYLRLQYDNHHNRAAWLWRRMYVDYARQRSSDLAAERLCSRMSLLISWRGELMPNGHESLSNTATTSTTASSGTMLWDV